MLSNSLDDPLPYNQRISILPGEPRIAFRPGIALVQEPEGRPLEDILVGRYGNDRVEAVFEELEPEEGINQWFAIDVPDAPAEVALLKSEGLESELDIVYFANAPCCGVCPPHPALATSLVANPWGGNPWGGNPWGGNPWGGNPWGGNPWGGNPWGANPWGANPWGANPEALNIVATAKPPMSSALPSIDRDIPLRDGPPGGNGIVIGVLDSGLAGGPDNASPSLRPDFLGLDPASLDRISGDLDKPSWPIGDYEDNYLDPVSGHGTFIAGIIEQLTPGCTIWVDRVFYPQGDVSVRELARSLRRMMRKRTPSLVNLSLGGTGFSALLAGLISHYHERSETIFVASAGNDGTCVENYPAALPEVIGVAAMGPTGPAPWSNYGDWVDASAPGTDLVSSFFANFDGAVPPTNGLDPDDFDQWATWSGTSFAAPVVVAALARELQDGSTEADAVRRLIRAPHLARLPHMGTIVNY